MAEGQITVREATYRLMRSFGIDTIFGNPGSTELPLFRDYPEDFRYILGLQESVVMGMADGYAQATRNAAFVNLHASAGVGHSLGNVFTAFKNYTPMIVTAGQQARAIVPFEPYLYSQQATEFPRPFVKWSIEPARPQDVPLAIARAYYIAMQRPRGPVFVSVPVDDWDQLCDPVEARTIGTAMRGDPAVLKDIADALTSARRPAIVVGAGIARDDAWHETIALAERHNAAVWVSPMSARASFPEDHALFAGFLVANQQNIVADLADNDVIVILGGPMSLYHVESTGPHVPPGARVFQIVEDPSMASWSPAGTATVADMKSAIGELLDLSQPTERAAPPPRAHAPALDGKIFTDRYLLQQIAKLRPAGSVIVEEAPSSRGPMHDYLPIVDEDSFYTCASGGLGHGLPAAIGVALGRPNDKIIAVLGDGSSMYAIQGLWTAAQQGLPISFIIINNRRYEALIGFGRHFGLQKTVGTSLPEIGFTAIAEGQGLSARRVDKAEDLDAALAASFADPRPNLLEVIVD